ncbi:hypothetical protein JYU06_05510, partial [Desulfotalea psychrophila]|nr:hypothetical protein [Desulfotalea psychrophila]
LSNPLKVLLAGYIRTSSAFLTIRQIITKKHATYQQISRVSMMNVICFSRLRPPLHCTTIKNTC